MATTDEPLPALLGGLLAARDAAPDRAALITPDTTTSFATLTARVSAMATGLRMLGVADGVRTVLLVPPGDDFVVCTFALLAAGAVPVLVDPGIGVARIRRALAAVDAGAVVGSPRAHAARALLRWAPSATVQVVTDMPARLPQVGGTIALPAVERMGRRTTADIADAARWRARPPGAEAAILFTSGSTGSPKGVVYRHRNFDAQLGMLRDTYRLDATRTVVATFAPFALFGPALGMTTVLPDMDFTRPAATEPAALSALIHRTRADVLFASPALLAVLADHATPADAQLSGVRLVLSAGAPVPTPVVRQTTASLTPAAVIATPYGMTEALPVSTIGGDELLATADADPPNGGVCVGRPVTGTAVTVIAVVDGPVPELTPNHEVAPGAVGEIVVAGPQVTDDYLARPDATAHAKTSWHGRDAHRTGDLGWRDDGGRLWYCGRVVHRVTGDDGPLHPLPVEQLVLGHPDVRRAALVAVAGAPVLIVQPSQRWSAAAAPWRPARRAALLSQLRTRLERTAQGRQVRHVLLRRRFPVDARHNAKIGYEQLARWATARHRRRPVWVGRRAFGGAAR